VKLTLLADDRVRYEITPGPLTIEAPTADTGVSPFHLLGGSLATCTFSVLEAWGTRAGFALDDLVLEVSWTFAEKPHRVDALALDISWPSLPASRMEAAKRAAALCTVHVTLEHPPAMPVTVRAAAPEAGAPAAGAPADAAPAALPEHAA
jgi:uncharacterized OsmC-like protein